jgi:acetolactate synthase-1/2/3 large subunit
VIAETFPARWERGHGVPPIERLPYFPEQAREALDGFDLVVLAGARDPISFFGYEGVESRLVTADRLFRLSGPQDDTVHALEQIAAGVDAPVEITTGAAAVEGPTTGPLNPASVGAVLARNLPEHAIVVEEAATTSLPFYAMSTDSPRHSLLTLTGGAIGQGLPNATGAALACPDRKVIAFQADGSGMYTLQALWTHARENLDIVTLICSNRAYRILQVELARSGITSPDDGVNDLMRLDDPTLDWVALARGCGVPGTRVETAEALERVLPGAIADSGPHLIEMMI